MKTEIRKVKEKYEDKLLSYPQAIGVETGTKEVGGEDTGEQSIRVLVKNKVSERELASKNVIPKTIGGFKTDVDDQGSEVVIPPLMGMPEKERTDRWRPCPFGVSIAHKDVTAGTQGVMMERDGLILNLSNAHVKNNTNQGEKGDRIEQPGPYDQNGKDGQLEEVFLSDPINLMGNSDCLISRGVAWFLNGVSRLFGMKTRFRLTEKKMENKLDAALGKPLNPEKIAAYVLGLENKKLYYRGSQETEVGEKVWTSGRTLGYKGEKTGAFIKSKDASIQVRYPNGIAYFTNQLHIKSKSKFSAGGMSGSGIALTSNNKVVGLLFAGNRSGTSSFANNIMTVEERFNAHTVDMCQL